jgi:hypothetical protein
LKEGKTVNMNKSEADWTSDHKIASMESRPDTDPGVRFYNSCLDWAKGLKKLSKAVNGGPSVEYKAVCIALNKRCVESGLIKDPSAKKSVPEVAAQPGRVGGPVSVDAGRFQLEEEDFLPSNFIAMMFEMLSCSVITLVMAHVYIH